MVAVSNSSVSFIFSNMLRVTVGCAEHQALVAIPKLFGVGDFRRRNFSEGKLSEKARFASTHRAFSCPSMFF